MTKTPSITNLTRLQSLFMFLSSQWVIFNSLRDMVPPPLSWFLSFFIITDFVWIFSTAFSFRWLISWRARISQSMLLIVWILDRWLRLRRFHCAILSKLLSFFVCSPRWGLLLAEASVRSELRISCRILTSPSGDLLGRCSEGFAVTLILRRTSFISFTWSLWERFCDFSSDIFWLEDFVCCIFGYIDNNFTPIP